MVKVFFCDRCGKELKRIEKGGDLFDDFFDKDEFFGNVEEATIEHEGTQSKVKIPKRVKKVQLCQGCIGGFNQIIDKANKEIKSYLEEGKKQEEKEEPKKKKGFGFFK